jgi:hypothetical protein
MKWYVSLLLCLQLCIVHFRGSSQSQEVGLELANAADGLLIAITIP